MNTDDLKSLLEAADHDDLRLRAQRIVGDLGFGGFLYANAVLAGDQVVGFRNLVTTYPEVWVERYGRSGFAAIDPAVRHCTSHSTPLIWSSSLFHPDSGPLAASTAAMYEEACGNGISAGVTIPLQGGIGSDVLAGISLARGGNADLAAPAIMPKLGDLLLFAAWFQEAMTHLSVPFVDTDLLAGSALTRKEADCLAWLADGLSPAQVARHVGGSDSEVTRHLERARRKLGARTATQAVARAFAGGLFRAWPGDLVVPDAGNEAGWARRNALRRVERAIEEAGSADNGFVVGVLDLDDFRRVNNALGHATGDLLLAEVERRLRSRIASVGVLAPFDGDAFLLLLPDSDTIARHASQLLAELRAPIAAAGHLLTITGSLGIARFPDDADCADTLLRCAELALYRAKELGGDRAALFSTALVRAAESAVTLEEELRADLEAGRLQLHYQPIIEAASGGIRGAEALVRWTSRRLGSVPPDRFIPLAEQLGLIQQLDDWVTATACRQLGKWHRLGWSHLHMAVNVAPTRFRDPSVVEKTVNLLAAEGLPAAALEIEITERLLMDSDPTVQQRLAELRAHGVRLSLDDFGTGYSSLAYLARFAVDVLKIDRAFVRDVTPESENGALVEAITGMAHRLGIQVVAEGVEQESEAAFLRACGCEYLQGFLLGRPMPAESFTALVQASAGGRESAPGGPP